ncbi:hypothetical protein BDZ94DRAFT_604233 [Collybia nuda]|uniref:DUF6534 domain-containing protein n=1 Tax=Collybia nuda TaxID=64659 RepID=A0A9P5Y7A4_9AGAR|nr:hypothetical protein BDZ94DRAFT_604233 [Collybia nuda]
MIPAPDLPPNTQIVQLTGPLIIGYLLNWGLLGTLTVQLYLYYEAFPEDRLIFKLLVYGVYIVELAQTIIVTQDAFDIFGYGFGDVKVATDLHHDWLTVPIMSGLVALVSQTFYAYRILVLSKSWKIPLFIVAVSLTSTVGGIVAGAFSVTNANLTEMNNRKTSVAIGVWCSASVLSDIVIAACMLYYLTKKDTGFRRTHAIVSRFIRLTIETGSVTGKCCIDSPSPFSAHTGYFTAATAIVNLIVFFVFPGRMYYTTPALIFTKLYANAMLVVLNARFQITHGRSTYASSSDHTANAFSSFALRDIYDKPDDNVYPNVERTIVTIKKDVLTDRDLNESVEMKVKNRPHDIDNA